MAAINIHTPISNLSVDNNNPNLSTNLENLENLNNNLNLNVNDFPAFNGNLCEYYTEDQFKNKFNNIKGFSIINFNCRSMKRNWPDFLQVINNIEFNFDVITITETWLSEGDDIDSFNIEGYTLYCTNRLNSRGGGVAIFMSDELQHSRLDHLSYVEESGLEVVTVSLEINNQKIKIGCIYRPPNTNLSLFNTQIECYLEKLGNSRVYVCGDYNVNLLNYDHHDETKCFVETFLSKGLIPLISKPTRITRSSSTIIDNIFTSELNETAHSGLLITDVSDHLPIFHICCAGTKNNSSPNFTHKRKTGPQNIRSFIQELSDTDWSDVLNSNDVNTAYNCFSHVVSQMYNQNCPLVKTTKSDQRLAKSPWMRKSLVTACKKKEVSIRKILV